MIVEIESPKPSCQSALDYNEEKVAGQVAELVAYRNLPGTDSDTIYDTFARYEKTCYPIRQMSFHASVNPSEVDSCSEEQVLDFIGELMAHLGYKDQPVLVYRHHDIEREHYHIVSVRADASGRKINNLYEKRKTSAFMRSVASKYGFSIVSKGEHVRCTDTLMDEVQPFRIRRFSAQGNKTEEFTAVCSSALSYNFDGFQQLQCILEGLGVEAVLKGDSQSPQIALRGLDAKGKPVTEFFSEQDLGVPLYERCMKASLTGKTEHSKRFREKDRLRRVVAAAMKYSKSQSHFENILKNKGVSTYFHLTREGEIFGVTFTDHTTHSVFKASELSDVISIAMMKEAVQTGRWRVEDKGYSRNHYVDSMRHVRDINVLVDANIKAGVLTRKEHIIGQPKGNAVRKKNRKTQEQLRQEYEDAQFGGMNFSFEDDRFDDKLV